MSNFSVMNQLIQEHAEMKAEFQRKAQTSFKKVMQEFFEGNPNITAVIWTQYSPWFNDGEECVFGVHEPVFTNAGEDELDLVSPWGEYDGDTEGVFAYDSYGLKTAKNINTDLCKNFSELIQSGDFEEVMESMFGNHVKVTATRNGFDIQDYEHD